MEHGHCNEMVLGCLCPQQADRKKAMACPLLAAPEQLKGLPPAFVLVVENDVLRDEGQEYARKLIQAGVDTTAIRILATCHDFAMLNGLAGTAATKVAIELASEKLMQTLDSAAHRPAA